MLALLAVTTAFLCPIGREPLRSIALTNRRAAVFLAEGADADPTDITAADPSTLAPAAWPTPAASVADLQQQALEAKEAKEAEQLANPMPFTMEEGGFSAVALVTFLTFVVGGALFFQGISGGGALRFAGDQPPEVQECIRKAATREDAGKCLPPVPLDVYRSQYK